MSTARDWAFYQGVDGSAPVQKELQKADLAPHERARLFVLLNRVKERQTLPGDVKDLGDDLLEVRLTGDHRTFRLLYAEESGGLVLLALSFFQKKSQKTPSNERGTASKRLREWRRRSPNG
ncbi:MULTISPECIES: type II toxin-antitoxin system RelE/ParE family toxin [unclassified Streptomyces]|uniref:type II toxin-antitoxin system RelE/ParE family toxin n=1 Tax=Streptomycetaceae TaxID=2062 RepID=UPI002E76BC3E|nr:MULTISPECIES: type II toxin-antitoxin system RelE/ParE family toxin [unclassified Streptomyces]MED7954331.1 type II toxin-antitoxin system RelE/ParE family toxin [Streptomyces sp. BE303]MEE1826767.1 type II toxin-antitoxin system RelE/ParE family toxin [Streptomyces sp. BE20]